MITNISKPQTYLDKLKELKAQVDAFEYRLDKLIEAETGAPEQTPCAFVTREQAAKLLLGSIRKVDRLAQTYNLFRYKMNGRPMSRKADFIKTQTYPKIEVVRRKVFLNI